jgi:hypothetical protein
MVKVPTALAIAEIATNQRVEGGGACFIRRPPTREILIE